MSVEAIVIMVLLGLLDLVMFAACFALEEREEEKEEDENKNHGDRSIS